MKVFCFCLALPGVGVNDLSLKLGAQGPRREGGCQSPFREDILSVFPGFGVWGLECDRFKDSSRFVRGSYICKDMGGMNGFV